LKLAVTSVVLIVLPLIVSISAEQLLLAKMQSMPIKETTVHALCLCAAAAVTCRHASSQTNAQQAILATT
jgi:hypothetical protein